MNEFNLDKAKEILANYTAQAEELLQNPAKVEELLQQLENKMKEIPSVGEYVSRLPLMISMVRAYITQEYTEVSPKVVGSLVGLVLFLVGYPALHDLVPYGGRARIIDLLRGRILQRFSVVPLQFADYRLLDGFLVKFRCGH